MSSIVDRIFGWFSGSRKEEEPVAEEENVAAQEEEQALGFRGDEYEHGPLDEPVDEEERAPDFDYDDHKQPDGWVDELERAPAFKHEDRFPPLREQDKSEAIESMKPMWLREKKEEES